MKLIGCLVLSAGASCAQFYVTTPGGASNTVPKFSTGSSIVSSGIREVNGDIGIAGVPIPSIAGARLQIFSPRVWDGMKITGSDQSGAGAYFEMHSSGGLNRRMWLLGDARVGLDSLNLMSEFSRIVFSTSGDRILMTLRNDGNLEVSGDVYSRGSLVGRGEPGAKGDKGDPGLKGDKGDKGDTGSQGPSGATTSVKGQREH